MKKLSSLTIFFPFMNDAGTVEKSLDDAFFYGAQVAERLQVIALHGGKSSDQTWENICTYQRTHPTLYVIDRSDNTRGYAVITEGIHAATAEWIFYTDGDAQYDLSELILLIRKQQETGADVVNGYKIMRGDDIRRRLLGRAHAWCARTLLHLPIRDPHADFRLMRASCVQPLQLKASGAAVLSELLIKLDEQSACFAEVPVSHRERASGSSNYSLLRLIKESFGEIVNGLRLRYTTKN